MAARTAGPRGTMAGLYPGIEPHAHGMLDVGDGNRAYWEVCGNPAGKPALALHGGPGSGCTPGMRRYFDPDAYRIVLLDQRGCGRSTPHASDPTVDLSANTTHHLLADIELLRRHLAIDRWLVLGGSWGSTLGLAYAERHPDRVTEIVLFAIGTTRRHEVRWITRDVERLFPERRARFRTASRRPSATATSSRRTTACCTTPIPPYASRPLGPGASGRTRTSPCGAITGTIPATAIRRSEWASRAS